MKLEQVALQLYTLRERMKTREEIETTLTRVKEIGYPAIQISGLDWSLITEADLVALCNKLNLTICATHESTTDILQHPEKVVQRLNALSCKYTAYPYPGDVDFSDPQIVTTLIEQLNASGKILAQAGQTLTYHNHQIEFRKVNGKTILQDIFDRTDPTYLQAEIDTYWVQYGGGDSETWCRNLNNRLPLLHLKDYAITDDNEINYCEIGAGNLDFKNIITAAETSGCQWFIVEQDTCPDDEFDSITKSLNYIREHLVE